MKLAVAIVALLLLSACSGGTGKISVRNECVTKDGDTFFIAAGTSGPVSADGSISLDDEAGWRRVISPGDGTKCRAA